MLTTVHLYCNSLRLLISCYIKTPNKVNLDTNENCQDQEVLFTRFRIQVTCLVEQAFQFRRREMPRPSKQSVVNPEYKLGYLFEQVGHRFRWNNKICIRRRQAGNLKNIVRLPL